jgi:threonine aldolase
VDGWVDLRSDTVTRPTSEMRRAMAQAEVGDDGYGEDPSVNALEDLVAELLGHEAALFVPSGVMANQIVLRVTCRPGNVVIAGQSQHIVTYEREATELNSGVRFRTMPDSAGWISLDDVRDALTAPDQPRRPSLLALENSHMASSGRCWPVEMWQEVVALARTLAIPTYLDGARLFNAAIALERPPADWASGVTFASVSLSKGLGAPVGSVLASSSDLIAQCRRHRAMLGGGMRQAGILAAAGLVGLRTMVDRLAEDHRRADALALRVVERWPVNNSHLETGIGTNIIIFHHDRATQLLDHLRSRGVLAGLLNDGRVRLVTHLGIDDSALKQALDALSDGP